MQPAMAKPSACTGDGPARPELSSVIDVLSLVPESMRSPTQVRSMTVGGLAMSGIVIPPAVSSYRTPATGDEGLGKIGFFETSDVMAIQASGRTTSR